MAVDAVLFDWGGTLSEFVSIDVVDVWRLAARSVDPEREDEVTLALYEAEARLWARTEGDMTAGRLADIVADALDVLGVEAAEALVAAAHDGHLEAWEPHIRHDPHAGTVLAALRDRGVKVGLLSNTHWPGEFHDRLLERDGLGSLLDARCYTSDMAWMKPHPEAFGHALSAVGVDDPTRAVFVGDRPYDDVHGAKQLGMKAVLRPNPHVPAHTTEPDAVIASLPELLDLVDRW